MKLSFLGAGNLPEAIINALVQKLNFKCEDIAIYDKNKEQYERYNINIIKAETLKEAVIHGKFIFLAAKPQNFPELLTWIKELKIDLNEKVFISVAAAISIDYIQEQISQNIAVIRTMPNTPVMIGEGMTAICKNEYVTESDFKVICDVFDNLGKTIILGEEQMNKIISVNGSSPAYIYLFAEAMIEGAVAQGFDREQIYDAVMQSLYGSVVMLRNSDKEPRELIKAVASPGGTTERALNSLDGDKFIDIIKKAMSECTVRADEITELYTASEE